MTSVLSKSTLPGSKDPFSARLFAGMFELRDYAFPAATGGDPGYKDRQSFDSVYRRVMSALEATRASAVSVSGRLSDHHRRLENGEIVTIRGNAVFVIEPINELLRDDVAKLLVNATMAVRGIQKVTKLLGLDISYFYQTDKEKREKAIKRQQLTENDPLLVYLELSRSSWYRGLVEVRNALEHGDWTLPRGQHKSSEHFRVEYVEPHIENEAISAYCARTLGQVCAFAEDVIAHALTRVIGNRGHRWDVYEIPIVGRNGADPRRFVIDVRDRREPHWVIRYNTQGFYYS